MPVEHIAPRVGRLGQPIDSAFRAVLQQADDRGADVVRVNRIRRQPTVERQFESRRSRKLDDLPRTADAGAVHVPEANGGVANAPAARLPCGVTLDVQL